MFCKMLPIDIPAGNETPVAEYHFGQLEERLEKEDGPYECDLYSLVQHLYRVWLQRRITPLPTWDRKYRQTCHYPVLGWKSRRHVSLDAGKINKHCPSIPLTPYFKDGINMSIDAWYLRETSWWNGSDTIVHSDPLGYPTMARVREWIEYCNQNHIKCQDRKAPRMPTRILDVGDSETPQFTFLVETQGQCGRYIALSHCWGKANSFLLTHDTLEDMKRGFPLEQAPATFRDAIIITRKLGIRYLWIDSLCIIQGDTKDWEIESSRMGEVYRDAYLTIAASSASSDEESFLKPRRPACSSLNVVFPSGKKTQIFLTHQNTQDGEWIYNSGNFQGPLATRGWTLQEAYLSRRQLKFLEHNIVWDCHEHTIEENDCKRHQIYARDTERIEELLPKLRNKFLPVYEGWYTMIQRYSARQFSFHSDRLPALSGLATLVAKHRNGDYLAGIWWEDAVYGLCWERKRRHLTKPDCYIAPSWSWASVLGPVDFPTPSSSSLDLFPLDTVLFKDYGIRHSGCNNFGRVDSGWVRIEAPLASFASIAPKGRHERRSGSFVISGVQGTEVDATASFDFPEDETENLADLRLLFLLRSVWDSESISHRDDDDFYGIVIKAEKKVFEETCEDVALHVSNSQRYKRVGFFQVEHARHSHDLFLEALVTEVVLI